VSNIRRSSTNARSEWRNLTNLCYLLVALLVPYFINYLVDLAWWYSFRLFNERNMYYKNVQMTSMSQIFAQLNLAKVNISLATVKDITNDIYHASNFYMYIWLSSKYRNSVRQLARKIHMFCLKKRKHAQNVQMCQVEHGDNLS
jgi:hypothetical protein